MGVNVTFPFRVVSDQRSESNFLTSQEYFKIILHSCHPFFLVQKWLILENEAALSSGRSLALEKWYVLL